MPPEDEEQPTQEERLVAVKTMTEAIAGAREKFAGAGQHTTLRRLNKVEYQKTISDLLSLNIDVWNPAEDFPAEVTAEGFDNDGAQLVTSGLLLQKYLPAAEAALNAPRTSRKSPRPNITRSKRRFISRAMKPRACPSYFRLAGFVLFLRRLTPISTAVIIAVDTSASCHCYGKVASLIVVFTPSAFGLQRWGASMTMVKL